MFIYVICLFVCSDGFRQLLCEASSCIGIAGNQLKFYTFACKLESLQTGEQVTQFWPPLNSVIF